MKSERIIIVILAVILCGSALARGQEMDTEISNMATNLASQIKGQEKKKVAVIDFTDLDGSSTELGKYIAEQLTVDLVTVRHDFSVLDRGNLRKVLAEHKLTATGLVDPENAKKLGQFAGVDAIILGTVTPKKQIVAVTAKIITTDTAEIVGAAKAQFTADDIVQQLVSKPTLESTPTPSGDADPAANSHDAKPKVVKVFDDLRVEIEPLEIVEESKYILTFTLINQNTNKSIWTAVSYSLGGRFLRGSITDSEGHEFTCIATDLSGVEYAWNNGPITHATEIKPRGSTTVTIKFAPGMPIAATPGRCRLQLELLLSHDFKDRSGTATVQNLIANIEAH